METVQRALMAVLGAVLRLVLWLVTAVLAVGVLAVALVLLLLGMAWALVRGRRPGTPAMAARFGRYATQQMWAAAARRSAPKRASGEVIDAEIKEIRDPTAPPADARSVNPPPRP